MENWHIGVRLKTAYSATAIVELNAVVFFLVLNSLLYVLFYVRDRTSSRANRQGNRVVTRGRRDGRLFSSDGSPTQTGRRNDFQLGWFDYGAYSNGTISEEYASKLLTNSLISGVSGSPINRGSS